MLHSGEATRCLDVCGHSRLANLRVAPRRSHGNDAEAVTDDWTQQQQYRVEHLLEQCYHMSCMIQNKSIDNLVDEEKPLLARYSRNLR